MRKEKQKILSPFEAEIARIIRRGGPLDIGRYMGLALGHPKYGYYMKHDPLGAGGDFVTAPEVSQLFGEVVGAWIADIWDKMGKPASFVLLECGPGRGTLMADIMRITKPLEGFHDACEIHLLEASPALRQKQEELLAAYDPAWHETLESVPRGKPIIAIGNEFLDALPIRQIMKGRLGWQEVVVTWREGEGLGFGTKPLPSSLRDYAPQAVLKRMKPGEIFEISPARAQFWGELCAILKQSGGASLFFDYGHVLSMPANTLQAVYRHDYAEPLDQPGDVDLTAHVDFQILHQQARLSGASHVHITTQGHFLKALGISDRAQLLSARAKDPQQEGDLREGVERLTAPDQMGKLFKVIGVSYGESLVMEGFE